MQFVMDQGPLLFVSHLGCLLEYSISLEQRDGRSQWPRGLRCGSAVSRLVGLWVRIPPGACMSLVVVARCQVEVSASGWSLDQRFPLLCWLLSKLIDVAN